MGLRKWVCAALLLCANAFAASTTNMDDQWGNPNEIGWGLSIQQQGSILFVNMFVYGQDGQPTWFVAPLYLGAPAASGHLTFTGELDRVVGTFYGAPWNQAAASLTKVGTMTLDADSVTTANLSYTADGVTVNKRVQRELWSYENYSGNYGGGLVYDVSNCGINNGHIEEIGLVSIQHSGNTQFSMAEQDVNGATCTYAGAYSQLGHMGDVVGNYSCSNGNAGSFHMFEMEKNPQVISGRFIATSMQGCQVVGHFGGIIR